jgi:hypothetical protein
MTRQQLDYMDQKTLLKVVKPGQCVKVSRFWSLLPVRIILRGFRSTSTAVSVERYEKNLVSTVFRSIISFILAGTFFQI